MENNTNEQNQKKLNLFEKIQAVSNEIKNIEKDMQVGSGTYAYKAVSDLNVVLAVKESESKNGIVSIPTKQELIKTEIVQTQKGGTNYVDVIKMTVKIINLENTSEFIEIESFGRGLDSGDKGFGKASTYARKYALLNAYKIATGEDPDKDKSKDELVITADEKKDQVLNFIYNDEKYRNNILSHFGVGSTDDLDNKQIKTIYEKLKEKNKI
ncbi:MAG: ERF family protein [Odoribacter sp.]